LSHLKEQKDKNYLNCNALVYGRFCPICGQKNIEPGEPAWHLVTLFFADITHFNGKFFSSLQYLMAKPGFLPGEYKAGCRASYYKPCKDVYFCFGLFLFSTFTI
jgi:Protein of unknown function (DUF3667)